MKTQKNVETTREERVRWLVAAGVRWRRWSNSACGRSSSKRSRWEKTTQGQMQREWQWRTEEQNGEKQEQQEEKQEQQEVKEEQLQEERDRSSRRRREARAVGGGARGA